MKGFGQHGEDLWLDEHVFKGKRNGVFVEVGVGLDGLFQSNTAFFEKERGWDGLLIEPVPTSCVKIRNNRSARVIEAAVVLHEGVTSICIDAEHPDLSHSPRPGEDATLVCVPAYDLVQIAREAARPIDLLSIDTEGTELDVLESNDWTLYRPAAVIVEHTTLGVPGDRKADLAAFMADRGYDVAHTTEHNLIFLKR